MKKRGTDGTNLCYIHIPCDVYLYTTLKQQTRLCYVRQDYSLDIHGGQQTSYRILRSDNCGLKIKRLLIHLTNMPSSGKTRESRKHSWTLHNTGWQVDGSVSRFYAVLPLEYSIKKIWCASLRNYLATPINSVYLGAQMGVTEYFQHSENCLLQWLRNECLDLSFDLLKQ